MFWAEIIVYAAGIYLSIGFLFAVWFAARGADKLDAAARGAGLGFRLIVFFGALALWILLARQLAKGIESPSEERAETEK